MSVLTGYSYICTRGNFTAHLKTDRRLHMKILVLRRGIAVPWKIAKMEKNAFLCWHSEICCDNIIFVLLRHRCLERYRSGHNEAVLKTVCPQGRVGSNPTLSAGGSSDPTMIYGWEIDHALEMYPSWPKGLPWKGSRSLTRRESSNLSISARQLSQTHHNVALTCRRENDNIVGALRKDISAGDRIKSWQEITAAVNYSSCHSSGCKQEPW